MPHVDTLKVLYNNREVGVLGGTFEGLYPFERTGL